LINEVTIRKFGSDERHHHLAHGSDVLVRIHSLNSRNRWNRFFSCGNVRVRSSKREGKVRGGWCIAGLV
jgi:hypothetical protein